MRGVGNMYIYRSVFAMSMCYVIGKKRGTDLAPGDNVFY